MKTDESSLELGILHIPALMFCTLVISQYSPLHLRIKESRVGACACSLPCPSTWNYTYKLNKRATLPMPVK